MGSERLSKFQHDLTQGSVAKQLLLFSLPFLASNLLQALYNMADMLIVGWFNGSVGATAVGMGGQVTILVINLISGLAVGGTVLIAQYIGAKRQEEVAQTVGTMFSLYAICGAIITVVMLLLGSTVLRWMNTPAEAFDETLAYLNICMGGTLFVVGYNAVSAVLRGMGDSKHPLIFVAIACVVNIILDLLLVGAFDMGAAGAAWATIAAQAISFIISVIFLRGRDFVFDFHPRSFRIHGAIAGKLVQIGLPASLQGTLVSFSFMVLTSIANMVTVPAIIGSTTLSVASKVNSVAILPSMAMQASVSSMVGQNMGAGKPERAKKTMWVAIGFAFAFSVLVYALVNLFPNEIIGVFIGGSSDPALAECLTEFRQQSATYLRCISYDYLLTSVLFCINGLAIGVGQTLFSMCNGIFSSLLLRIPAAYLFGEVLGWGLAGVGLAAPTATVGGLLIAIVYLLTGSWKRAKIAGAQREKPVAD